MAIAERSVLITALTCMQQHDGDGMEPWSTNSDHIIGLSTARAAIKSAAFGGLHWGKKERN